MLCDFLSRCRNAKYANLWFFIIFAGGGGVSAMCIIFMVCVS